jgi:DNA-directed RNA polymerase specialized sigma24 family protein
MRWIKGMDVETNEQLQCLDDIEVSECDDAVLMRAAAGGDEAAWSALVQRFAGLVWSVARAYGLSAADAATVSKVTWLRLGQHLHRLPEPVDGQDWLVQTAHRESKRTLRLLRLG